MKVQHEKMSLPAKFLKKCSLCGREFYKYLHVRLCIFDLYYVQVLKVIDCFDIMKCNAFYELLYHN